MSRKWLFLVLVIIFAGAFLVFVMKQRPRLDSAGQYAVNLAVGANVSLPEKQAPVVVRSYDFEQTGDREGWKPVSHRGDDRVWAENGRLHFRTDGVQGAKLRNMDHMDAGKINLIELRVPKTVSRVSLSWLTELGEWSLIYFSQYSFSEEDWHTISVDVGESSYWRGRIKGLTIAFWTTSQVQELQIDWIRFLGDENPSFVMRPGRVGYAIAGERQWVIPSVLPGKFEKKVMVPPAAKLKLSCGLSQETWQSHSSEVNLQVSVQAGRDQLRLLTSERLQPKALGGEWEWKGKEISLEEFAGQRVTLIFESSTESKASGGIALWGNPTLEPTAAQAADTRPNLIIILVDALRPDHLGLYGYEHPTSPNLDELAKESIVFDNAFVQAHCTHLSVASLFTSWFPLEAKTKDTDYLDIKEEVITLAEQLEAAGYLNTAFSGSFLVHWDYGFDRGFDVFRSPEKILSAEPLTDKIVEWLEGTPRSPFFVYVHYMDPHAPYKPPEEIRSRFLPADYQPINPAVLEGDGALMRDQLAAGHVFSTQDREYVKGLYDAEVAFVDAKIGRLLESLRQTGEYDNTAIVVIADHGEEFWDHGGLEHARVLYDETIRTPLIIKLPANMNRRGERISDTVRLVDIYPAFLELAGVGAPSNIRGESLLQLDPEKPRWEYAEAPNMATLRGEQWKLIAKPDASEDELYNIEEDPAERKNVAAEYPEKVAEMRAEIGRLVETEALTEHLGHAYKKVDPKTLERLRALGYVK